MVEGQERLTNVVLVWQIYMKNFRYHMLEYKFYYQSNILVFHKNDETSKCVCVEDMYTMTEPVSSLMIVKP